MDTKRKMLQPLNRLELASFWKDEAREFTPWLAEDGNLALLGQAVGMELELEGREVSVGNFRVDIVARDVLTGRKVIIENQLDKTDHGHLGQLLTYAAGHDAVAVIWISREMREEHRSALDWLNEHTTDHVSFFGLEIELWQIGNSAPAAKFNLVAKPNDWARSLRPSARGDSTLTDTKMLQLEFWQKMIEYFELKDTKLSLRSPRPQHWFVISLGRSNFHISLSINSRTDQIGCEVFMSGLTAKTAFHLLELEKIKIEKEIGAQLTWMNLPLRDGSRIVQNRPGDLSDRVQWPELFAWLKERSERFHAVFASRIQDLDLEDAA